MKHPLAEHSPLSAFDEYPIHQCTEPLRFVATTDPRMFERYWFTAQDDQGEIFLVTGFGFYPNLGTADAYAIFVHNNKQTSVRAHRGLDQDRSDMTMGPLCAEIIEPFREWRLTLADNAQDLKFDLRWRDSKRAIYGRRLMSNEITNGLNERLLHSWAGYESFGTIEGTIDYQGKRFQLKSAQVRGSRDHHWGIRNNVGGTGHMLPEPRSSHFGQWVEFADWSIWMRRVLYNLGDDRPGTGKIEPFEYKLRFDPETKHFIGGIVRNRLGNGEIREVTYEQINNQVAYLRCGLYHGPDGRGTPEENYLHGVSVGELVGGETYDLSDPKVRLHIGGFENHLCRVTCNGETVIGILECKNPVIYEKCVSEVEGFSILED